MKTSDDYFKFIFIKDYMTRTKIVKYKNDSLCSIWKRPMTTLNLFLLRIIWLARKLWSTKMTLYSTFFNRTSLFLPI